MPPAISGRNAGRPVIAIGQLVAGRRTADDRACHRADNLACWTLASANMLFILAMLEITLQTYKVVLKATSAANNQAQLAHSASSGWPRSTA